MAEFKIANQIIGDNHPQVVIAEIGINHGGSIAPLGKKMIRKHTTLKGETRDGWYK